MCHGNSKNHGRIQYKCPSIKVTGGKEDVYLCGNFILSQKNGMTTSLETHISCAFLKNLNNFFPSHNKYI